MEKIKNIKVKSGKGITLIALVITIIVLLILAGVTIATLTGDNGILTRAQEAKNKTEEAEREEKEKLGDMEDILDEYATGIKIEQVTDENPGVLEGTGTDDDPYTINSIEDLVFFANDVTNGNTYEGKTVKLGLSLDFNSNKSYVDPLRTDYTEYGYNGELKTLLTTGTGFYSIGDRIGGNNLFKGNFDGNGNFIKNLYININNLNSQYNTIGLFNQCEGTIENLFLYDSNITAEVISGHTLIGSITGNNKGMINHCIVNGKIDIVSNTENSKSVRCGGIAGQSNSISNCGNETSINIDGKEIFAGGIIGWGSANVNESYNNGNILIKGDSENIRAGGICGWFSNQIQEITDCYNTGNIEVLNGNIVKVGGIIGYAKGNSTLNNLYNKGEIKITAPNLQSTIGGIVGVLESCSMHNIVNYGNIELYNDETKSYIGGIVGECPASTINFAYDSSNKLSNIENNNIGECVGRCYNSNSNLSNIYAINNQYTIISKYESGIIDSETVKNIREIPELLSILGDKFEIRSNNIKLKWE